MCVQDHFSDVRAGIGRSLVEHWLFGSGCCPGRLVRPLGGCASSGSHSGTESWPGSRPGRARCWVLRERPPVGLTSTRTGSPAVRRLGVRDRPYLENCTVDASIICSCQVNKGTRWMPWHQEPMKDVGTCDKPRGVGNQTLIRGFPNGET